MSKRQTFTLTASPEELARINAAGILGGAVTKVEVQVLWNGANFVPLQDGVYVEYGTAQPVSAAA